MACGHFGEKGTLSTLLAGLSSLLLCQTTSEISSTVLCLFDQLCPMSKAAKATCCLSSGWCYFDGLPDQMPGSREPVIRFKLALICNFHQVRKLCPPSSMAGSSICFLWYQPVKTTMCDGWLAKSAHSSCKPQPKLAPYGFVCAPLLKSRLRPHMPTCAWWAKGSWICFSQWKHPCTETPSSLYSFFFWNSYSCFI